jgi:N-acetylmuramoyl-L-alanine amidase
MLLKTLKKFLLLCFAILLIPSISPNAKELGSSPSETAYKAAKKKYVVMRISETKVKMRDNWVDVIDTFLSVYLEYPDSERGDDSLYMVGRLYEELYEQSMNKKDLSRAIDAYEKLIQNYPKSTLTDDARFKIANIYRYGFKDFASAYSNFDTVVKKYPNSDMKPKAEEYLKELSKYVKDFKSNDTKAGGGDKKEKVVRDTKVSGGPILTGIRTSSYEGKTRIVFDLSENTEYTYDHLKADDQKKLPYRIFIDIKKGAKGGAVKEKMVFKTGSVTGIRTGDINSGVLRVVLDLVGHRDYKIFPLKSPDRIVVDISLTGGMAEDVTKKPDKIENTLPTKVPELTDIKVIVIDAGHGGKDPGAIGPTRYYEKRANYKIAKYLKEYLKSRLGLTVIMTRDSDRYLKLKSRTAIANKSNADLFISIHNNASRSRSVYGTSTYYLAVTSDRKALAVAARENDTTIERLTELDYILTDLMVSAKRNESSLLAKFVQDGMVLSVKKDYSSIKDLGVMQGPFWVLVGAQMPSILVECSYISNPREEQRLKSDKYLKKIAFGIYKGIEKYINEIDKAKENW